MFRSHLICTVQYLGWGQPLASFLPPSCTIKKLNSCCILISTISFNNHTDRQAQTTTLQWDSGFILNNLEFTPHRAILSSDSIKLARTESHTQEAAKSIKNKLKPFTNHWHGPCLTTFLKLHHCRMERLQLEAEFQGSVMCLVPHFQEAFHESICYKLF